MTASRNRKIETMVYVGLWILVVGLYLLDVMRNRARMSQQLLDSMVFVRMAATMLPFMFLFLVNNYVLIPRFLLKNKLWSFFLMAAAVVAILSFYQYLRFMYEIANAPAGLHPGPHPLIRPLIPLPVFLDCIIALLVVGCNIAIVLLFQRFDDKLEKESLMKANAETQLAYLKSQINPHFYMNMLNNIHGMIEIDPGRAQSMVIDMSGLMRYMLYDSSKPFISLADEVAFVENYLRLMRQRFPENRVAITSEFPQPGDMNGIMLPPLLFLVFIENAFKHGISYCDKSYVAVSVSVDETMVRFCCINSNHAGKESFSGCDNGQGIGLRNVSRRLELIYGSRAVPEIDKTTEYYKVNLAIPYHETVDTDNR